MARPVQGVEIFQNKMVVTRAPHRCVICLGPVEPGSRVRAQTEHSPTLGCVRTFYVCAECCEACRLATVDPDDAGRAIEARTAIGTQRERAA